MQQEPLFVLGVGAQKAGTTWLYHYLSRLAGADFGFTKEYHFHDCRTVPSMRWHKDILARRACAELTGAVPQTPAIRQLAFLQDPQLYYAYFASLYMAGAKMSGDITPAYSLLSVEVMADCEARFLRMGVAFKVVYIMRNPVERLVSSLRQYLRSRGLPPQTLEEEAALLQRGLQALPEEVRLLSAYDLTLGTLQSVFPPERLHLELFERLFTVEATTRLCQALGVPWQQPDLLRRWNSTGSSVGHLPFNTMRELAESQRQQVDACISVFGLEQISASWPQVCNLLGYFG